MTGRTTAINGYLEVQVATASPAKLVLMCYDGIIRFLNTAEQALLRKDWQTSHNSILKAQAIISELKSSLRMDLGDIPQNLSRIYDFMYDHLVSANIQKDARKVNDVLRVAIELREVWAEVIRRSAETGDQTKRVASGV